jgi:hypothetical protein
MYYQVYRFKDEIIITEQADADVETDSIEDESIFTPDEEKLLAQFDAKGSDSLGIIYSPSPAGIQDFINRSEWVIPSALISLAKSGHLKLKKIDGYGYGTDCDYTLQLTNLGLRDIKGLSSKIEKDGNGETVDDMGGGDMGGGDMGGGMPPPPPAGGGMPPAPPTEEPPAEEPPTEEPAPGPETAGVIRYGNILSETANITKKILTEKKRPTYKNVHTKKSRILKKLPSEYIKHLNQLITLVSKKRYNATEKKHLMADIIDNLALKLKLTPKQIFMSYELHKNQKKLKDLLDED